MTRNERLMKVLAAAVAAIVSACIGQSAFAGSLVGWGQDNYGQATPPAGNSYVAIAAGYRHSLALKSDGSIVGWGYNVIGQATPPAGSDFVAIAAGYFYGLALKSDGSIVGWGSNVDGKATPPAGSDYVAIATGHGHSLALKSDGSIVGWGYNYSGQATPPAGNDFVAIATFYCHSLALKSDGSVAAWGYNGEGQCNVPAPNSGFVAISAGVYHSLALKTDGSIVGWGAGGLPPAGTDFVAIAAGGYHDLAISPPSYPVSDPVTGTATEAGSGLDETDPNRMVEVTNGDVEIKFVPLTSGGGSVTITELNCRLIDGDGVYIIENIRGIRAITALDNGDYVSTLRVFYEEEDLNNLPDGWTERDLRIAQLQGVKTMPRWVAEWALEMSPEPVYGPPTLNVGDWGIDEVVNYVWANVDHFTDYSVGVKLVTGDFDGDRNVDFQDFSHFALNWRDVNCPDFEWCNGTDLDFSTVVDFNDLQILVGNWLLGVE